MKLHCYFAFEDKYTAYNFEKYLKSGSGRAFLKKHLVDEALKKDCEGETGIPKL